MTLEHDLAAEQGILLAVFQDPQLVRAVMEKGVSPQSFGVMPLRAAWEAILRLSLSDRPIDDLRLSSEMGGLWPRVEPLWKQAKKLNGPPEWKDFLPKLHSYQINRSVHEAFVTYQDWWKEDPGRVSQFLPTLGNMISGIGQQTTTLDPRPGIIYAENSLDSAGIPTGLPSLDRMLIGGFRPTELYLCSAPTKHGKTSMAASLASYQIGMKNNVIVFSLEMSPFYFTCRVICALAMLDWNEVVQKKPSGEEAQARWRKAIERTDTHMRIYPPDVQTPDEMSERIKWHMAEFDQVSLVLIDHIGLVESKDANRYRNVNTAQYLGEQAYGLKAVAVRNNVPVWMFSQLSEKDESELLKTTDLQVMKARGSGAIKQAADFAFLLARHGVNEAILRKKLDRMTGQSDKAVIKHDARYYLYYETGDAWPEESEA